MMTIREVAAALGTNTLKPRGWLLIGAPHHGEGRDATFERASLVAWCEEGAGAARAAGNAENAGRWQGYADRLRVA